MLKNKKMEERKRHADQVKNPCWIIRWKNPYAMECKGGTREEAEKYAKEKAEKTGNTYLIL